MKKLTFILALTFTFVCAFSMFAKAGDDEHKVEIDKDVHDFTLKDVMGLEHSLKELSKDKKTTVVMFIATQCPVSNNYNERMVKLFNDYKDKGIQFEEIAKHAQEHGFQFTVLKDPGNKIADYFGAKRTPEVYLLNEKLVLRYHGAIDSSEHEPQKATPYLRDVLDLVLAGKEIPAEQKETKAFGCTIKRVEQEMKKTP
ncbi:redoxin domain-containing protein [Candidatus Poribacteria bacterium]|nr:redoxin domain-containing protein [Candidatus Poribacteria bacterium]